LLLGKGERRFDFLAKRILTALGHVVGQWCQFKSLSIRDRAGLGHVLMAWGFFIFALYYLLFIIIGTGFGISEVMENNLFFFYYSWVMDIAAPLVIIAALWGIIRRYIVRPSRLKGEQTFEALVILGTVLIHPITHLFKVATSIALGHPPAGLAPTLPPISSVLSNLFSGYALGSVEAAHSVFFWAHWSIVLFVLVYVGYSRYLHMAVSPFNVLLRSSRPRGALSPVSLEAVEAFGVSRVTDFTRKQLLDLYACIICGQCQDMCPAYFSGTPLNPKKLIQDIKGHLLEVGPGLLKVRGRAEASFVNPGKVLVGGAVTEEEIWACTTCGACQEVCPVSIEHIDKVIDLRRHLVFEGKLDRGHQQALHRTLDEYNPWGLPWSTRDEWSAGLDVEKAQEGKHYDFLYWVGCAASFDDRVRQIAGSLVKVLKQAGLKIAILGNEEMCCGEFARRVGDEGLFQRLALANIQSIDSVQADAVVTHCPHCFHTMKDEYSQLGAKFQIIDHTQVLGELLRQGKLGMRRGTNMRLVYHDSCYLGRYHHIFNDPRFLLRNMAGAELVEMKRVRQRSFCCGAGGGLMWLEDNSGERIATDRVREAIQRGAQTIVTACPFCLAMLEDTPQVRATNGLEVKDIVELVMF
jgi:Fe-S oxidoreductase